MDESEKRELKQALELLQTAGDDLREATTRLSHVVGDELALVHNAKECTTKAREIIDRLFKS
jgi:signal transduction histidine kinase